MHDAVHDVHFLAVVTQQTGGQPALTGRDGLLGQGL